MAPDASEEQLATLRAAYEGLRTERDRIRDARGWASRQLGPLPSAAAITTGIVVAFSGHVNRSWLWVALGAFVVMVLVSVAYAQMHAYRQMRAERQEAWNADLERRFPSLAEKAREQHVEIEDLLPARDWYATMIQRERCLYGPIDGSRARNRYRPPRVRPTDLQDAFDRERTGLYAVQVLFLAVIVSLLLARLLA
jgi:hypothetical protein